jgi:hypothetical protein
MNQDRKKQLLAIVSPEKVVREKSGISNYFIACVSRELAKSGEGKGVTFGMRVEHLKAELKEACKEDAKFYAALQKKYPALAELKAPERKKTGTALDSLLAALR